ncbi:hypothetical protein BHYA_0009g00300 [Botrytis hyacinthi]|uniref:Uncharacterized protein n=1 Tax=Botrytis hyacinthi TaxID=278943 RepID=A0A4Z1H3G4_9HELO|nr:hypothetical protein BHYA_0009g00300 [Botrytis hyacinthi]
MSSSKVFNDTRVGCADVQPSGSPRPFSDQQPEENTMVSPSTPTKKCCMDDFPDAKVHSKEQATWSNGLARGDSNRTEGVIEQ